jgi:hypothetical protein
MCGFRSVHTGVQIKELIAIVLEYYELGMKLNFPAPLSLAVGRKVCNDLPRSKFCLVSVWTALTYLPNVSSQQQQTIHTFLWK